MAWVEGEFGDLQDALTDAFTIDEFDRMLLRGMGWEREKFAVGDRSEIVSESLGYADRQGRVLELVQNAYGQVPNNPKLKAFINKYPQYDPSKPLPAAIDHYQSVLMRGFRVFIDRKAFRNNLKKIGRKVGGIDYSRVLVVNGDRVSGKTYSRDFINFIHENDPVEKGIKQRIIYVNLDENAGGPEDLAKRIGEEMKLDCKSLPPQRGEQESRWVPKLAWWIVTGARNGDTKVWWVLLDGFRVRTLPPATHDLITVLAQEVDRDVSALRIVLLNYNSLPPNVDAYVLKEKIEPITREHLESFFELVYKQSGKSYTPDNIKKTVDEVLAQVETELAKLPDGSEQRLTYLSIGLTRAAQRLLE